MPKYVSYDEMMEILDNKYLLPFRKDERLRGLSGIDIVRCKDCRHANECHKSVQHTRNEPNTVTIGYLPIEWCSHGERSEE